MQAQDVLDFWFLPPTDPGYGKPRMEWFRKDPAFDAHIRERFGSLIAQALAGGLREWELEGPQGALARILVLDQFTRNAFREAPESFPATRWRWQPRKPWSTAAPTNSCRHSSAPSSTCPTSMPKTHACSSARSTCLRAWPMNTPVLPRCSTTRTATAA